MTLSTGSTALQIIRMINAPRARVYAAWTDANLARKWLEADSCATDELILEAWRGGRFLWVLNKMNGNKQTIRGKFRVVHPQEKIIHSWQWVDAPVWKDAMSLVTVEFSEKDNNRFTELRLTHDKLPDETSRDNHITGWNNALDKLDHLIAA
jgi:uncharacterized protein YndB with AHSA1/START domain